MPLRPRRISGATPARLRQRHRPGVRRPQASKRKQGPGTRRGRQIAVGIAIIGVAIAIALDWRRVGVARLRVLILRLRRRVLWLLLGVVVRVTPWPAILRLRVLRLLVLRLGVLLLSNLLRRLLGVLIGIARARQNVAACD